MALHFIILLYIQVTYPPVDLIATQHTPSIFLCIAGLHKSDQQYLKSAKDKAKKPNEEFLYATTASKRAERQRLVRFIRLVMALQRVTTVLNHTQCQQGNTEAVKSHSINAASQTFVYPDIWLSYRLLESSQTVCSCLSTVKCLTQLLPYMLLQYPSPVCSCPICYCGTRLF